MKKLWKDGKAQDDVLEKACRIAEKYNLSKLVSTYIAKKEIDEKDIEKYLNPTRHDFYNPFMMPDMEKAVERIVKAFENNEKILIYGDYDVDGITSSSILKRFMQDRGIDAGVYIPNNRSS